MRSFVSVMSLSAVLAGCGNLVWQTAAELEQFSPLEADPSMFAVAIDLPDGFGVSPQSAVMRFAVEQTKIGQGLMEEFILQQTGTEVAIFQVDESDYERLIELQDQASLWEQADAKATVGSLSVDLLPCLKTESASLDEAFSVSIRFAPDAPFRPLLRDVVMSSIIDASDINELPNCS